MILRRDGVEVAGTAKKRVMLDGKTVGQGGHNVRPKLLAQTSLRLDRFLVCPTSVYLSQGSSLIASNVSNLTTLRLQHWKDADARRPARQLDLLIDKQDQTVGWHGTAASE